LVQLVARTQKHAGLRARLSFCLRFDNNGTSFSDFVPELTGGNRFFEFLEIIFVVLTKELKDFFDVVIDKVVNLAVATFVIAMAVTCKPQRFIHEGCLHFG
jgi:hypothetical protein